jgi:hypothetical protein
MSSWERVQSLREVRLARTRLPALAAAVEVSNPMTDASSNVSSSF